MTTLDPALTMSDARSKQFYLMVKTSGSINRALLIKKMNCSMGTFQHEYTTYLLEYPQIRYAKASKEFVFDP